MLIKDKIALGSAVGIAASIPQLLLNLLLLKIGFIQHFAFQYAAGIFINKNLTYQPGGLLFGGLVWESMAAGLGCLIVYLLVWTGREYWWLKGLLISNTFMFIFLYGFYFGLEAPRLVPWDLESNLAIFIENIIFGIIAGYLAARWNGSRE